MWQAPATGSAAAASSGAQVVRALAFEDRQRGPRAGRRVAGDLAELVQAELDRHGVMRHGVILVHKGGGFHQIRVRQRPARACHHERQAAQDRAAGLSTARTPRTPSWRLRAARPGCHHGNMAVLFELVVNFGTDQQAAGAAAELVRRADHIDVRGVPVSLGEPYVRTLAAPPGYIEFTVHPRGIGSGGPGPMPDLDPRSLTGDEVTRIGHALYDLLRGFSGYRAAVVGWDPESLVDLEDLESDYRNGDPPGYDGLVLADDLCERWRLASEWIAFAPGYRWLPYSGSRNLWLPHPDNDLRPGV